VNAPDRESTDAASRPDHGEADRHWMQRALAMAAAAAAAGEVPVGAVLVVDGQELAAAGNRPIALADPTAHAEILTLRAAAQVAGNYRLPGTTLYVTLEPCVMCAGAIIHARVARVVYAAADPRAGAAGSRFDVLNTDRLNHAVALTAGCLGEDAAALLRDFFAVRRGKQQHE
jgi:tRNA(adenine34) deaminase